MNFFQSIRWIVNALVTISSQIHNVQQKLDLLIAASGQVPAEQLQALHNESAKLKAKTEALAQAVEKNK